MISMTGSSQVNRQRVTIAVLAPLPVVAVAVALHWQWWATLLPLSVLVACAAEFTGWFAGLMSAMVAAAGMALIVERIHHPHHPRNGLELGAMAVLLLVVGVAGTDRTIE